MGSQQGLRERVADRAQQAAGGEVATASGNGGAVQPRPRSIFDLINAQKGEIARALPKHMDADRLARIVTTTLRSNPRLMECSSQSLLAAVMLSAQLGLEPGPLGHAWFVPFKNRGEYEVTWILGYKGIIDLAYRSGKLLSIEAREVCEGDEFDFEYGLEPKLSHRPNLAGGRGAPYAYYGVAQFKDGGRYFLVMSKQDIEAHRSRSRAKDNGPWVTDYDAMARKTVIRVMAPFLPLTVEMAAAIEADEKVRTDYTADVESMAAGHQVIDIEPADGQQVDTTTGELSEPPPAGEDRPDVDAVREQVAAVSHNHTDEAFHDDCSACQASVEGEFGREQK